MVSGITCDWLNINMAEDSPPRKRYRNKEESPKSEDDEDENYVPYVPLKERRKTAVSF